MSREEETFLGPQSVGVAAIFRSLVLAVALSMVVILGAAGYGIYTVYQKRVISNSENDAVNIAQFLSTEYQDLLFAAGPVGRSMVFVESEAQEVLDKRLRRILSDFQIVKIKVYNHEKRIVFSTEPELIDKVDADNARLLRALSGQVDSHLESKALIRDLKDEKRLDVDVVETYVPIRINQGVAGAFEIYRDVTPYRRQIFSTVTTSVIILCLILLLANGTLFLFIRRASRLLAEAQEQLRKMAITDSLTGALNHGSIIARAQEEISRLARHRERHSGYDLSVILLDIDHFKKVNDTFGHLAGDQVLRELCDRVRRILRDYDILGRFGGEEFLIVLPDVSLAGAVEVAERLRQSVAADPCHFEDKTINITISLGVASISQEGEGLTQVLQRADKSLYMAKNAGRNRVASAEHPVTG